MNSAAPNNDTQLLEMQLAELRDSGAYNFDPVRFRYLESMLSRAVAHRQGVTHIVQQRASDVLQAYQRDLNKAKIKATTALKRALEQFPDSAAQIQQLFDSYHFDEMNRLLLRLKNKIVADALAGLAAYVSCAGDTVDKTPQAPSFDDILRQQEYTLINDTELETGRGERKSGEGKLDSIHYFRESLVKRNADKLVTQAIKEIPEGSGPLNAQKLIVQSLSSMRDLSPHYLNRFVAYIDTLLWLEKAGR